MKKNAKKFIATSLIATLAIPTVAVAEETKATETTSTGLDFTDVKEDAYYYEAITNMASRGIINGYGNGVYGPEDAVTRGQAAKIIAGTLNLDTKNVENPSFKDVNTDHMFYKEIAALKKAGIITGYAEENTYRPDATITRDEMAIILTRAFKLKANNTASIPFTDTNDYMKPFVAAIYEAGITTGVEENTYDGNGTVSRGQAATFIYRGELYEAAKEKVIKGEIAEITEEQIKIGTTYYNVGEYSDIFHVDNAVALKGANVIATIKNGAIIAIESVQLNAEGTKEAPITLTKPVEPVASLAALPANPELDFKLIVNSPFVKIVNLTFEHVTLSDKVAEFQLDGAAKTLEISENVKAIISGTATIAQLMVKSKEEIALNVNGKIEEISFGVKKALLTLSNATKVGLVQYDKSLKAIDFITNFDQIYSNIEQVNGEEPTITTAPVSGGDLNAGGYIQTPDSSQTPSITGNITGVVQATSNTSVTIGANTYSVDEALAPLFANTSLKTANISVKVQNGKVVEVNGLTINSDTTLSVTGVTIKGDVTIAAQNVKLQGLVVNGNVIVNEDVEGNLEFTDTQIHGKVLTAAVNKLARAKKILTNPKFQVAALDFAPVAELLQTKLKITFNNSTVIEIEINKNIAELNVKDGSFITSVLLKADASVFADADIVLPNLTVTEGVTNVQLNATIKNVEISTNDNLTITGNGNIDNLEVKSEKAVDIQTTGVINSIAVAASTEVGAAKPSISLGENVKVGEVKSLDDSQIDPAEIITNYGTAQAQINTENVETIEYIAAKLLPVEGKYGVATLAVVNADNRKIKYRQTDSESALVAVGQTVPSDAIDYTVGDTFVAWFTKNVEVYVVDDNNKIVDAYSIQEGAFRHAPSKFTFEDGNVVIKTNYDNDVYLAGVYLGDATSFFYEGNTKEYKYTYDENGIPTFKIPAKDITIDLSQGYASGVNIYSSKNPYSPSTITVMTGNDQVRINLFKNLAAKYQQLGNAEGFFAGAVSRYKNNLVGYEYNRDGIAFYFADALAATTATTIAEFDEVFVNTFESYKNDFEKYTPLKNEIESIFIPNTSIVNADVTSSDIEALVERYNQLDAAFKKDLAFDSKIIYATKAANDLKQLETKLAEYKTLANNEKMNAEIEIVNLIPSFTFEKNVEGTIDSINETLLRFIYTEELSNLTRITPVEILRVVKEVNARYTEAITLYEELEQEINQLYVGDVFSPSGTLKEISLVALVNIQDKVNELTNLVNARATSSVNQKLRSAISSYHASLERPASIKEVSVNPSQPDVPESTEIQITFTESIQLATAVTFNIIGDTAGLESVGKTYNVDETGKKLTITLDKRVEPSQLRAFNLIGVLINADTLDLNNIPLENYVQF